VLATAPLEPLGRGVYRRPRRLLAAVAIPAMLFLAWDVVGIARGHWSYDDAQIVGWSIGPVPIEEVLFFLVIPLCALLTLEAVRGLLARWSRRSRVTEVVDSAAGGGHA
jgi:lycopene cyclase domain-containing protein